MYIMVKFINNKIFGLRDGTVVQNMYHPYKDPGSVPSNTRTFRTTLTLGPSYLTLSSNSEDIASTPEKHIHVLTQIFLN